MRQHQPWLDWLLRAAETIGHAGNHRPSAVHIRHEAASRNEEEEDRFFPLFSRVLSQTEWQVCCCRCCCCGKSFLITYCDVISWVTAKLWIMEFSFLYEYITYDAVLSSIDASWFYGSECSDYNFNRASNVKLKWLQLTRITALEMDNIQFIYTHNSNVHPHLKTARLLGVFIISSSCDEQMSLRVSSSSNTETDHFQLIHTHAMNCCRYSRICQRNVHNKNNINILQ